MPILLGNKVAVNLNDLVCPGLFPSYEALKKKLQRDRSIEWGMRRISYGGHCRELLVDYDTLPKRYQCKITDPRKAEHPLEHYYTTDKKAVTYYNDYQYPDGSYLLPETIDELIINASVLKAVIQLEQARINERITKGGSTRGVTSTLYTDVHKFNAILLKKHNYQHTLNGTLRGFKSQLNGFKSDTYYGIIKDPEGKSKRNAKKRDERIETLLRNLLAGREHKPTPTEVAVEYEAFLAGYLDIINKETGELYNPKEYKKIGNRTITAFLSTWDSKIGTDAKRVGSNRQPLVSKYIPSHSFQMPAMSGSMISIDDRQPPFHYNKNRDRMWWYIGIDLASEAIVAWAYGKSKKELIKNFYRNMVANHNQWHMELPAEIECESSLNSSFTDTFLQDGAMFEHVTMFANMARSKRIERFFKDLRYSPDFEKNRTGWLARPHAKNEANQEGPGGITVIPYDVLVKQCFQDIINWNNMPKKGTNMSRFDYYLKNQNPDLVKTNYKSFIQHLGTSRSSSCKAGIVQLDRKDWLLGDKNKIFTGEKLINLLKQVEQKTIQIYFLDDNKGKIIKAFVYDKHDGRYICEILQKPKYQKSKKEKTKADTDAATLMSAYTNTVAVYQRTQKNTIEAVEVINNRPKTVSNSFSIDGFDLETEMIPVALPELPKDIDDPFGLNDEFTNDPTENL